MKLATTMIILFSLSITLGCKKDIPEPEMKLQVFPVSMIYTETELPVVTYEKNEPFAIQYHIADERVFVECLIPAISFRENSHNQGKMILYVDGKRKEEITTAAFIIKGLSKGTHRIKIVVVKPNNEPLNLQREFDVTM